jgi:hypothetical protein
MKDLSFLHDSHTLGVERGTPKHKDKVKVFFESRKRELKTRPIYECWCDERLKTKSEKATRLGYTGLLGELEHLKIKTRLIDEMFHFILL